MFDRLSETITLLTATHSTLALVLVFAASAGEALFVVGSFVPGVAILVGVGALVGAGRLPFVDVLAAAALGALVGDFASYWLGRHYRDFVRRIRPFPGYAGLLSRGEAFVAKHGATSLLLGHFVPGLKTVVPTLAGVAGMGRGRFLIAAAIASALWAAAILVPSMGLGLGISRLGALDPRLLALLAAVLLLVYVVFRLARFAAGRVWPMAVRQARRITARAIERGLPGASFLDSVVHDRGRIVARIFWVAAAGFAVMGFADLTLDLVFGDTLSASDQAISNFVQSFRTGSADDVIVSITMAGDGIVLAAVGLAVIGALIVFGDFAVAAAVAVAAGSAALFVPFIKDLLQRARPQLLYDGADAFSFPSGHASLSMTVIGIATVLLVHRFGQRNRLTAYALAVSLAVLIGFTRIYLAAHWPSDVGAGLLFGAAVVSAFAFGIHGRPLRTGAMPLALAVAVAFAASYAINVKVNREHWVAAYLADRLPTPFARADWLDGGWRTVPQRRVEFDGETGEPLAFQTDLAPARIAAALLTGGWSVDADPAFGLFAILPAQGRLDGRRPLPLFHDGRRPEVTATREDGPSARLVLRFWPSGLAIDGKRPLLVGSVTRERLERVAMGYSTLETGDDDEPADIAPAEAAFRNEPGIDVLDPAAGSDGPLLLVEPRADGEAE